jgi:hypothetical protein
MSAASGEHDQVLRDGVVLQTQADASSFMGMLKDDESAPLEQQLHQEEQRTLIHPRTHIAIAEAPDNDSSRAKVIDVQVLTSMRTALPPSPRPPVYLNSLLQPAHLDRAPLAAVLTLLLERRKRVELNM